MSRHAISTSAEFPGAIPTHLVVRPALIKEHPDLVQALVKTWFDTLRWIKDHKDAAITINESDLAAAGHHPCGECH